MAKPIVKTAPSVKSVKYGASQIKAAYGILDIIKKHSGTFTQKKVGSGEFVGLKVHVGNKGHVVVHGPAGEIVNIAKVGVIDIKGMTKAALRPAGNPCPRCNGTGRI